MRGFVSYQAEDESSAREIGRELDQRGHSVALYPHRLSDPVSVIAKEMRQADLLLLAVGCVTSKSAWVAAETFAAQVRSLPIFAILLDEDSAAPLTLPTTTPVVTYPSLLATRFALFDIFPSPKMRSKRWAKLKIKISPYQHPDKDTIPPPLINRGSLGSMLLLVFGVFFMAASYLIGCFLPWFADVIIKLFRGITLYDSLSVTINARRVTVFLAWQAIFTMVLFYRSHKRLAYPLWALWFFKDYVPAWLSIRSMSTRSEMKKVMRRLRESPGNRAYWEREHAQRTTAPPGDRATESTKDLFELLSRDERRSGLHGEFDERGLSEIHALIHNVPDFDLGRYGRSPVMVQRSPQEVEVFSPQCPAPFCLCGKVVRLRKMENKWQIVSRNW
jgi:TIR domain-containing protein